MSKISIFSINPISFETAEKVRASLTNKGFNVELVIPQKFEFEADRKVPDISKEIRRCFRKNNNIIGVLPLGILVRSIEPQKKTEDPFVICIDKGGKYIISVLNGHRGANRFAKLIAEELSGEPILTTLEE